MDPVAIYLIGVLAIGALFAVAYVWLRRVSLRRLGRPDVKLTPIGTLLLVIFFIVLCVAVIARQFFPETAFGAWLRTADTMGSFVLGCVAVMFVLETAARWLGRPTSEDPKQDV